MKNKINNTMSYESQENLILGQTDAFIGLLTKRGILGDHQIDDEKIRIAQQEKRLYIRFILIILTGQVRKRLFCRKQMFPIIIDLFQATTKLLYMPTISSMKR